MTNGNTPFARTQEMVEAGLLGSIGQSTSNWLEVERFSSDDFAVHRAAFLFIGEHLIKYGNLPSNAMVNSQFGLNAPLGEFRMWLDEFKKYVLSRKVLESIQEGYAKIGDPAAAMNLMLEKLSLIRSAETNHIQAWDSGAIERLAKFDMRTENLFETHEMIGIRTGMKIIDETMMGWIPGSLVGCFARPGVGKTWWLLWQGINAWYDGGTVLAITPEMPANWLDLRVDVVAGQTLGYPIDYSKLVIGDPSVRPNYEMITKILAQSQRWWTYDSIDERSLGLGDMAALIRQHNPQILLVDGVSLLRSETRGQTWEQMKDICYGLKNMATIYEIPILVTHQAVNSARGRRTESGLAGRGDDFVMPSLNDAAFGDAFVQACSDVITMVGEPTSQYVTWYSIRKHRERGWRQPLPSRMGLACDFAMGKIYDLSEHGYSPETVGATARRLLGK